MEKVRVLNTRATFLTTPRIGNPRDPESPSFPAKRLGPGVNHLRRDHLEALEDLNPAKGPGKVWNQWKDMGMVKVQGLAQKEEREGPEAPLDLTERNLEAAEAFIAVEEDPKVLRQWYAKDRRKGAKELILARLEALGATEDLDALLDGRD